MSRLTNLFLSGAVAFLCATAASAQTPPGKAPVPPPPGLDAPGVKPAPPASAQAPARGSLKLKGMPSLPAMGADNHAPGRDGLDQPPPTMDIRTVGDNKVEEYRINGRLYMVRVIPEHGIPQTYFANPEGELMRHAGQPPVNPVFYTIYKWGGTDNKKDDNGQ